MFSATTPPTLYDPVTDPVFSSSSKLPPFVFEAAMPPALLLPVTGPLFLQFLIL
jgi:hypothetical protein